MREPQNPVAGEQEGSVAGAVSFESAAGAVKRVAVELHDQPLPEPYGVDLEAGDEVVDSWQRQAMLMAEIEEGSLELRAGEGNRVAVIGEHPEQSTEASSATPSQADVVDRAKVKPVQALGLLNGAGELGLRKHPPQVE